MKRFFLVFFSLSTIISLNAQTKSAPNAKTLAIKSSFDSLSYAIGVAIAPSIQSLSIDSLNYPLFVEALKAKMKNKTLAIAEDKSRAFIETTYKNVAQKKQQESLKKNQEFLAFNKNQPGVYTTPSGLQYYITSIGSGGKPTLNDTIVAHYKGMLIDGKEFDNSYKRGTPLSIGVKGVIPGWTEGLQLFPAGSKFKLFIPANLAYGDKGAGQDIPPGATLIFDIELLEIKSPK